MSMEGFLRRKLEKAVAAFTATTPVWETNPEDVFIVGYPKSGHTWLQNLVSGVVYGVDPARTPDAVIQELVPDVYARRFYRRFSTPMFFKSHELPKPEYKRVIYLLRDGRDAMVSYLHFTRALSDKNIDFADFVRSTSSWCEHVETWLTNPYQAQIITIRYEDLLADPARELARVCEFAGIESEAVVLKSVAERATFTNMRNKEVTQGWDAKLWPKDKHFVRRGIAGSYKDEMPPEVLELFMQGAQATLSKCGYA
jgi:hypothetical protein